MKRLQVQLTEAQLRALRERARVQGISLAAAVRQSLDGSFNAKGPFTSADPWQVSLRVVGHFAGGAGANASEEHDRHLADVYGE